ncbi:hypothetical protein OHA25_60610 (plasmid) [Nonomuraea sp. NBC_00507]|uniref:hypothetical protein n=1 Tax=Nonomuraea sp. NBC_00507 TaxID=2976002 RepID=UPI002E192EAB
MSTVSITTGQHAPVDVPIDVARLIGYLAMEGLELDDEEWNGGDVIAAVLAYLQSYGLTV